MDDFTDPHFTVRIRNRLWPGRLSGLPWSCGAADHPAPESPSDGAIGNQTFEKKKKKKRSPKKKERSGTIFGESPL